MHAARYGPGQSSAMRKSSHPRLEVRPSLLPKPARRPGSTDRLSTERRSTAGHRSSSAEPARTTYGGPGRLSREASATKLPLGGRSRSQTTMTPLRSSQYSARPTMTPLRSSQFAGRPTTTPQRTPSGDRGRNWQASLERVLAFVTVKDKRDLTNSAWQRTEYARVQALLSERQGLAATGMALIRPLTIARFVDIVGGLLNVIAPNVKLSTDNYVAKLPNHAKKFLYPGTMSKSWLKTVNTLHAFPHALALIAYLLDLANHIEMPVNDEMLYVGRDEHWRLRWEFISKCWITFQDPDSPGFSDLAEEYFYNLSQLLGNSDEKIEELQQQIEQLRACLEDPAEIAARADEARRLERRNQLLNALNTVRAARCTDKGTIDELIVLNSDHNDRLKELDHVLIEQANLENHQLQAELEAQSMSVLERRKLLEQVDYAHRVLDSKQLLAEQISKMVSKKENELAWWQIRTLESCVEYKQGLILLSSQFPQLAAFAIDEKELMNTECAVRVTEAVTTLRQCSSSLAERRAEHSRNKNALARQRHTLLKETHKAIAQLKDAIAQEQVKLTNINAQETSEAEKWEIEFKEINAKIDELKRKQSEYKKIDDELEYWESIDKRWRNKISSMQEYIQNQREESDRIVQEAIAQRTTLINNLVNKVTLKMTK